MPMLGYYMVMFNWSVSLFKISMNVHWTAIRATMDKTVKTLSAPTVA